MYQKMVIIGHLGKDPEMQYTPAGQAVTHLNVATSRKWTGSDGQPQEETTWFRVSVWGKQAESCNQYLSKGRLVLVEGRLTTDKETGGPRVWTDQNGNPRASYEMSAFEVRFLGGQREAEAEAGGNEGGLFLTEEEIPY